MRHFCTYFDCNYLTRGLAMYSSLKCHCQREFTLWILCFDDQTYGVLAKMGLPQMRLISLAQFEKGDEQLLAAKRSRSLVEYYWTCTPSLPLYLLKHFQDIESITYIDADVYFYSDPAPLFDELGEGSVLIMEHRYAPKYEAWTQVSGIFNVEYLTFRRDKYALECLNWWRDRCNEWCYARHEAGKYGDQKYLDDWPQRFKGIVVSRHPGAGLAPWNAEQFRFTSRNGHPYIADDPVIFHHFHGLKLIGSMAALSNPTYCYPVSLLKNLYFAYFCALHGAETSCRREGAIIQGSPAIPLAKLLHGLVCEGWLLTRYPLIACVFWKWAQKRRSDMELLDAGYRAFEIGERRQARCLLMRALCRNPRFVVKPGVLAILVKSFSALAACFIFCGLL